MDTTPGPGYPMPMQSGPPPAPIILTDAPVPPQA